MSNSMEPGATMADAPVPVQDALSVVTVDAPPAQPQQEEPQVDELQVAPAAVGDANKPEDPNDTEDEGMGDDDDDDDEPVKSHDNMQSQDAQMELASEPLDHAGTDAAGTSGGAAEDEHADGGGEDAGAEQVQSNADDPQDAPMEIIDDSAPTDCATTGVAGSSAAAAECEGAGEDTSVEQTQPNVDEQSAVQAVDETSEPQTAVSSEGDENMHEAVENARTGHGDDEHLHDAQDGDNHHDTDEYDPADPGYDRASDMYERHGSDEYDPANPSSANDENAYDAAHAGDHEDGEYDPANPGGSHHDDDEYDPANPSYDQNAYDPSHPSSYESSSHQVPQTQSPPESGLLDAPDATLKRKSSAPPAESGATNTHDVQQQPLQLVDQRASKRQRSHSSESTRSLDRKPDNIEPRRKEEDKKGLSDAAWDRLKDFQSGSSDFEMTQVSRAAFASVSSLPEFAQVSIVARFTRVPMKDIRDKNGQLMRIYHEYLKENPHIPLLQPVSVYIADYRTDPGLFEYGYAPPFPVHGISSTPVPYQKEDPVAAAKHRTTRSSHYHSPVVRAQPAPSTSLVDEFGRDISIKPSDPRRPTHEKGDQLSGSTSAPQQPPALSGRSGDVTLQPTGKPSDPRRRQTEHHAGESEFVPHPTTTGGSQPLANPELRLEANELFERLPRSVKLVLHNMVTEGRLQEALNDNVLSRLHHLPEHVALRAVENFSNVDLTQIDNLQGFLVGIINRVNEKAIAAEQLNDTQHGRPATGTAAAPIGAGAAPVTTMAPPVNSSAYAAPGTQEALLAFPTGEALRQSGFSRAVDPRGAPPLGGAGGYYDAPPSGLGTAPHGQQGMPILTAPSAPVAMPPSTPAMLAKTPSLQQAIGMLPLSVQTHLQTMAVNGVISSIDEFGEKCYEVLGQLSEALANEVLTRFTNANLTTVRNRSGFLIGVVKRCRQEYGFN